MSSIKIDCDHREKKKSFLEKSESDLIFLQGNFPEVIFSDEKMVSLLRSLEKISPSSSPVLILGETGTGKELIAKAVHEHSGRSENKMIPINCSAMPENILEAELFGYEKGAFTGADQSRSGILGSLEGGTLFLDEIGDMPLNLQAKLLRLLQEKKYRPLGSRSEKQVDVRFVAATNKNLAEEVKLGRFRSDLFYRLNVLPVRVPSLRERKKDIGLLLQYFLDSFNKKNRTKVSFHSDLLKIFSEYAWPGNVRELYNFVERLSLLKGSGVVSEADLPCDMKKEISSFALSFESVFSSKNSLRISLPENGFNLDAYLDEISLLYIKEALERTQNNKKEAARLLSLKRTTLVERIKKKVEEGKL